MVQKPTHNAYTVRNYEKSTEAGKQDASQWSKIGVAFSHKDGKGLDLVLDAVPVDGRVVLRVAEPKTKA
jgi:hypothetical protein